MEKYIEWDLKNNPDFFKKPQTGRYVDTGVLRHVVTNVNCPEGLSDADFFLALNAVAEEVDCIPLADVAPVVRCRECKFAYRIDGPKEEYDCRKVSAFIKFFKADHFCSYGEKKDGGSNE